MGRKKQSTAQKPEPRTCVTIRQAEGSRKKRQLDAWRFWEISVTLQEMGGTFEEAHAGAHWATRAKPGAQKKLPSGITMEVGNA